MKKIVTSLIAIVLCIATCIPVATQTLSAKAAKLDTPTEEAKVVAEVGAAVAKYAFGRAYAELSSWAISNDVPVVGSLSKLMLDPSQRSALKRSAQVTQILGTVTAISGSITQISDRLSDISDQLYALDKKTDLYHAADLLNSATQSVKTLAGEYNGAWSAYCKLTDAVSKLGEANDALAAATDPDEIEKLQAEADAADKEVVTARNLFIQSLTEGGGKAFYTEINDMKTRIYDSADPTASYLGALENYLRLATPFEHQITEQMTAAAEGCGYILYHMFLVYSEYYTYLREYTDMKNEDNPDAENPYDFYSDEYFTLLCDDVVNYCDEVALAAGITDYMVSEPMSEAEIAEYRELDPNFVPPESIDTNVTVNGVTYPCYKVRANSDNQYYLILKQHIDKAQLVQTATVSYFSADNATLCRPSFVLDHEYTDDNGYRLISESEIPGFIKDSTLSVLSYLRVNGGLLDLPQNTEQVLLRDADCVGESGSDVVWDLKAVNLSDLGKAGAVTIKSNDVKNGKAGTKAIAIYRLIDSDTMYKDGTYQVLDKSEIENKTVFVGEGQTLDLTKLTVDVSNVNIRVVGNGKIVSNSKITLKNSRVTVVEKANVTIENLNLTARSGDVAAVVISATGSVVTFAGTNKASGTSAGSISAENYYANYVPGNSVGTSHGVYAVDNTILIVNGSATFSGANGGAGICAMGKLSLIGEDDAKVVANGSSSSVKKDEDHPYFPLSIGAGIGGSVSVSIEYATYVRSIQYTTTLTKYFKLRSDKSVGFAGSTAYIQMAGIEIEAKGVDISNINSDVSIGILDSGLKEAAKDIVLSSYDIGGASVNDALYDIKGGAVSSSTIALNRTKISDKINTEGEDNAYKPEIYTFTVFTHGSDGTTKNGISFILSGSEGDSDWITAGECGTEKGYWTGSFVVDNVGIINSIKVKSNKSGDKWFGGQITIKSEFGGQSVAFYGGRFISDSGTWLYTWDPIYKVTIETGSDDDSGTDADIGFQIEDGSGVHWTYQLDSIHWEDDAFEKGDLATFYLYNLYDNYLCTGFYLSSDCSGSGPQWKVDRVTVEKVNGKYNVGDSFTVYPGYWFRTEQTVFFGRKSGSTGAFYIEVKTSDVSGAGTNSNIYLTVNGSNGSTGEIELDLMAEDGDNYERGDLDVMCIGFDKKSIGEITSITIRKDDAGRGPDWHLEYIIIKEIISKGQTPQAYKFTWKDWIEDETVTLTNRTDISTRQSTVKLDREILSGLTLNDDGGYTLTVDREITLSDSAFELISEKSALLTVVMENDEKPLYEVVFDGSEFESWHAVTLGKGYAFADGKALFDFLQNADLPTNTKIRIHAENLGFLDGKSYQLYAKDEAGNWSALQNVASADGVIEFYAQTVKALMVLDKKNAWITAPSIDNYVSGETPSEPVGEALYGSFTVRYTGTAADGTQWDSSDAPTMAGKYTATFTVEATDSYDGLTYELDFEVAPSENEPEPDNSVQPDDSVEPAESADSSDSSDSVQPQEEGKDLTWLYVVIAAVVMFGAGFGIGLFCGQEEKD